MRSHAPPRDNVVGPCKQVLHLTLTGHGDSDRLMTAGKAPQPPSLARAPAAANHISSSPAGSAFPQ